MSVEKLKSDNKQLRNRILTFHIHIVDVCVQMEVRDREILLIFNRMGHIY